MNTEEILLLLFAGFVLTIGYLVREYNQTKDDDTQN